MRKAIVEQTTGRVLNTILLEDGADWTPPKDYIVLDGLDASPGDTWDGAKFVKPIPPVVAAPEPPPIIGFMDAVLTKRGLGGFSQEEWAAAIIALKS